MRALMVSSEVTPFAQTGGLGEVMNGLPAALVGLGVEVDVLMPKYRRITPEDFPIEKLDLHVDIDLNAKRISAGFWQLRDRQGVRYLFLENDHYYNREGLYGTKDKDYKDNSERFVFFCRSAISMALSQGVRYDIFHSHDWQAALVPVYLRTLFAGEELLRQSASIMTIHNLGYQGVFWHLDMPLVGVGWEFFNPGQMEFYGQLNFLKSGIVFADEVNTVSPSYRNEVLTREFGFGLDGVLREKGDQLTGILNGVDYSVWNPATDIRIGANYSPDDLSGKAKCKADLQRVAGLRESPDIPVIGLISRLSSQKGLDILQEALPSLMQRNLQLVMLGTGEPELQKSLGEMQSRYAEKMALFLTYDHDLAHKIFAGADIMLVPSRYEPCGLTQLYGLKYGAVPLVRATGGLNDSVQEYDPRRDAGTGFKFGRPDAGELEETVGKALYLYRENKETWKRMVIRGMKQDFSWKRSAAQYKALYEKALRDRSQYQRP